MSTIAEIANAVPVEKFQALLLKLARHSARYEISGDRGDYVAARDTLDALTELYRKALNGQP